MTRATLGILRDETLDGVNVRMVTGAEGGIVVASREDIAKTKPLKKELSSFKRFQVAVMRFQTPLYRSQI